MIRAVTLSIAAIVLCAGAARADVAMAWSDAGIIVVAHDSRIEGFDRSGEKKLWSAEGLASPSSIVTSPDGKSMAILDGYQDRVAVVTVADGKVERYETPGTPVAAAFFGRDVWIILRDARQLLRITPEGQETEVRVAIDPALLGVSDKFVYVYSRGEGLLQEIDPALGQVTRTLAIGSGATDLEIRAPKPFDPPGATAYVCRPPAGRIVVIDLTTWVSQERGVGTAPIDLTFVPLGAQLTFDPHTSVIADPGKQGLHISNAPGKGGNLFSQPTPVDRVVATGAGLFAFDTSSGTVYRIEGRTTVKIASGLTATSWVPTDEAVFTWDANAGRPRREAIAPR